MLPFKYTRILLSLAMLLAAVPVAAAPGHQPTMKISYRAQYSSRTSIAQTWISAYGSGDYDLARGVVATADGGYAVAGYTSSFGAGNYDFWVLKLDSVGAVQWQRAYGGPADDLAYSLIVTADGGYAVAGATASFGAGREDAWVLKLDTHGNVQWQKTYGGSDYEWAESVVATADGGYALAGKVFSFGAGEFDAWVLKLDADGAVQWQKTYGGSDNDYAESLVVTADSGYAVAGYTYSFGAARTDVWVLKLDAHGAIQWQKTYGGSDYDYAFSLVAGADGGYVVAGQTFSFGDHTLGDAWALKLDADGNVQWQEVYRGSSTDLFYSVVAVADGSYIVAGQTASFGAGGDDAWLVKLDAAGNVQGQKTYGGNSGGDIARNLVATADGGYALAGWTRSFGAGENDAWILKLDADGRVGADCPLIATSAAAVTSTDVAAVSSSATVADSTAVVTASAAVVSDTTATESRQCALPPRLHVGGIDPSYRPLGNEYRVSTRVEVQDEGDGPVPGATVLVDATLPNSTVISGILRTHADGSGGFWFLSAQTGTYQFCVRTVRKPGWTYDPSQNVETCDRVVVP